MPLQSRDTELMYQSARLAIAFAATVLLASCGPLPPRQSQSNFNPLSDGTTSGMSLASNAIFNSLTITKPTTPTSIKYRPVTECSYTSVSQDPNGQPRTENSTIIVRRARDKLQVVLASRNGEPNILLIGESGKVYDYNIAKSKGARFTPSNYKEYAYETLKRYEDLQRNKGDDDPLFDTSVSIEIELLIPEYLRQSFKAGDDVGLRYDENRKPNAITYYVGSTIYKGKAAHVLTSRHMMKGYPEQGNVVVAFYVIDPSNGLPLLWVADEGSKLRFDQVGCK